MKKKRFVIAGALAVVVVLVVVLIDGYILGPMNWERTIAGREPVLCRCVPHDGGGCWYYGITYTIFTSFDGMRFDSRMSLVQSKSREGRRNAPVQHSASGDAANLAPVR